MEDEKADPGEIHPERSHPDQSDTDRSHPNQAHTERSHTAGEQRVRDDRLEACRRAYAERIAELAGIAKGSEIAAALATIPRERFVGPAPWRSAPCREHAQSVAEDPAELYQDIVVSLGAGRGLNNGQPSLHAMCLKALGVRKGEHAVQVGAGTGYYTAMLAMLVGETGRVDAYEIEPELAERARANLAEFAQVAVHCRSGAKGPLPDCDVLYVNAAAAEPLAVWLDALRPEGRLLFPLEPENEGGAMLLVTRQADGAWAARFLCGVQFVACAGAQDAQAGQALKAAFRRGNSGNVRWLHRSGQPDESCWCAGRGWWLGT
ncbi:MAG: protein-L-isoaspartate O-methyltransferase family protein [Terracidiphilus sp.]